MKKLLSILLGLILVMLLVACGSGEPENTNTPPGFTAIQDRMKLSKHSKTGENAAFSTEEFCNFLGTDLGSITVTELPAGGVLVCNGTAVIKGQTIAAKDIDYLKFIPDSACREASFGFTCDSAGYNGRALTCTVTFSDTPNLAPVAKDSQLETVSGIACYGNLNITEPNGDNFTVNVITYPSKGYLTLSQGGGIVYFPEEGFSGKDELVYTVTDPYGEASAQAKMTFLVEENESGIVFADMAKDPAHIYAHRMCANDVMIYRSEQGEYYFDPDAIVSKMDFLVMLMCACGLDKDITAVADSIIDDDTGLPSGMKGYLSAASEQGLILLDSGKFSPDKAVTLLDAAYMVSKALKLPISGSDPVDTMGTQLQNSVMASVNAGIISNKGDSFEASAEMTKAEVAELLCRIEDYMTENNIKNDD